MLFWIVRTLLKMHLPVCLWLSSKVNSSKLASLGGWRKWLGSTLYKEYFNWLLIIKMDGTNIYNKMLRRQSCTGEVLDSFEPQRRKNMSRFLTRRKQSIINLMHNQPTVPIDSPELLLLKKKLGEKERLYKRRYVEVLGHLLECINQIAKIKFL